MKNRLGFRIYHDTPVDSGTGGGVDVAALQAQLDQERQARHVDSIKLAKLEAQQRYPQANSELLSMFQGTDLQQIEEFAKKLHEQAVATALPSQPPAPAPPAPAAPPIPTSAPSDVPTQANLDEARVRELTVKMNNRSIDPTERDELAQTLERTMWNRHVAATRELSRMG